MHLWLREEACGECIGESERGGEGGGGGEGVSGRGGEGKMLHRVIILFSSPILYW